MDNEINEELLGSLLKWVNAPIKDSKVGEVDGNKTGKKVKIKIPKLKDSDLSFYWASRSINKKNYPGNHHYIFIKVDKKIKEHPYLRVVDVGGVQGMCISIFGVDGKMLIKFNHELDITSLNEYYGKLKSNDWKTQLKEVIKPETVKKNQDFLRNILNICYNYDNSANYELLGDNCASFVNSVFVNAGVDTQKLNLNFSGINMGHTRLVDVVKFDNESLDSISEEAIKDVKSKRAKIEALIFKTIKRHDKKGINKKRYEDLFKSLDDKQFGEWMQLIKEKKEQIFLYCPNQVNMLKMEDLLKTAKDLKLELFERIWQEDPSTGKTFLTPEKYLIIEAPIRRQQQFLDKEMSVSASDQQIDGLTGQAHGDDRASGISKPEIDTLAARGLEKTLEEFISIRGGNPYAYDQMRRMLEETGSVKLSEIDKGAGTRTARTSQSLYDGLMLEVNLVKR